MLTETTHIRNHLIEGGSLTANREEASCKNSKCLKYKQKNHSKVWIKKEEEAFSVIYCAYS